MEEKNKMLGVIIAQPCEAEPLLDRCHVLKKETIAYKDFYLVELSHLQFWVAICGIGKVNASIATQIMISNLNCKNIINLGIAGALKCNLAPCDFFIATKVIQHDFDLSEFGREKGTVGTLNIKDFYTSKPILDKIWASKANPAPVVGTIVSGDQFLSDKNHLVYLKENFDATACDMESGGIAQTCYLNGVPFGVIKCFSDNVLCCDSKNDYVENENMACLNLANFFTAVVLDLLHK